MNKILLITLVMMCQTIAKAQFTNSYHTEPPVNGNVDSVAITRFILYTDSGKIKQEKDSISKWVEIYDRKGRLITTKSGLYLSMPHSGVNKKPVVTHYRYDPEGNLIESMRYFTDGKEWVKNVYAIHGDKVKEYEYYVPEKRLADTAWLTIDASGKILRRDSYSYDGKPGYKYDFQYNDFGMLVRLEPPAVVTDI